LIGLFGVVYNKNVFIKVLSLEVMNVGVVLLFVTISYNENAAPPIFLESVSKYVDPIPQAVIITSIVIGFSILALSVSVISSLVEETRREKSDGRLKI
jgi:multicomponent Na+:H+ antiporter subunit C